jgi:beta-mannanase
MATPAILWGAYTANTGPDAFEQLVGRKMSIYHSAAMWAQGYQSDGSTKYLRTGWPAQFQQHWSAGRLVMHDWGSYNSGNKSDASFALSAIAAGSQDTFLHAYARDMAAFKHPIMFRLNGEMNGSWEPYYDTAGGPNFIAAWRHVVDLFRADGATNVTWVWCPNITSPPGSASDTAQDKLPHWYPGDSYVDWTGFDAYNWSTTINAPWMTFDQLMTGYPKWYGDTYHAIQQLAPSKPMLLGEFASHNWAGDKSLWIKDALLKIPALYPALRAVLWFNASDASRPVAWPLSASDGTATAFSVGVSTTPPYVGGGSLAMPVDLQPIMPFSVTVRVEPDRPDVPWLVYTSAIGAALSELNQAETELEDMTAARDELQATFNEKSGEWDQERRDLADDLSYSQDETAAQKSRADNAERQLAELTAAAQVLARYGVPPQ